MGRLLWGSAWLLLALTNLFWAGNIVLGRGIAGQVPPVALAWWRWTGACAIAFGFAWPHLRREWPLLLRQWKLMLLLSATGIACFNAMSYIGLNSTSALNVLLLQSALPLVVLVWVFALFGERPSPRQAVAVGLSLAGVAVIAGRGSWDTLLHLRLNPGDVWIIVALVIYGAYIALLRRRPAVHQMSFLVVAMGIGSMMLLPFMLWEMAQGARITGGAGAYLAIAYTAVFPSFLAYLCFNRGVELLGSALAGQSVHLTPVFGAILAVLFLGEAFQLFHAVGVALIGAGIVLASVTRLSLALPARR